ncbi:putative integral membrane protein [Diaporthe ampelina]|uniref:Putative integral membrane protein n=1 Tax=Diaporthe ampelina TaxID=1214573 RepID=A0A0G2G003_9PEZI|nr:putative integral membrane protein [Diaporthe ampelina]
MAGIENRGPVLSAVSIFFVSMAVVSFTLRAYVRTRMVRAFGVDDWFMLLATIMFILFVTCVNIGVHYGTGRHYVDLSQSDFENAMQFWYYCYIWYCWTMIFSKISIAIFLLRIIVERIQVWFIYGALAINVMTGLVFFFVTTLQCQPISYFWHKEQPGTCVPIGIIIALTYLYSSLNIICDFTFALLPIFIVRKLNMKRRMKVAIMPLLSMGCIASSAVVVRLAYVETFRDPDFLYATVDIATWSTVEGGLAVTAGSLACIRPLFKVIMHRLGLSTESYLPPSKHLPGGASGRGAQPPPTIGSSNKALRRSSDIFHMGTLFTRVDNEEDAVDDKASTTKLVQGGGIVKTSTVRVQIEPMATNGSGYGSERGGSSTSKEDLRMFKGHMTRSPV